MSNDVISFRLNDSDPSERKALEILARWRRKHELRHIMTRALLALEDIDPPEDNVADAVGVLAQNVRQMMDMLSRSGASAADRAAARRMTDEAEGISQTLMGSIRRSVKAQDEE